MKLTDLPFEIISMVGKFLDDKDISSLRDAHPWFETVFYERPYYGKVKLWCYSCGNSVIRDIDDKNYKVYNRLKLLKEKKLTVTLAQKFIGHSLKKDMEATSIYCRICSKEIFMVNGHYNLGLYSRFKPINRYPSKTVPVLDKMVRVIAPSYIVSKLVNSGFFERDFIGIQFMENYLGVCSVCGIPGKHECIETRDHYLTALIRSKGLKVNDYLASMFMFGLSNKYLGYDKPKGNVQFYYHSLSGIYSEKENPYLDYKKQRVKNPRISYKEFIMRFYPLVRIPKYLMSRDIKIY